MSKEAVFSTGMVLIFSTLLGVALWDAHSARRRRLTEGRGSLWLQLASREGLAELCLMLVAYTVFSLFSNDEFMYYNNYNYLADAWLHGRLDVPDLPAYLESVQFGGTTYVHFAPGPALLCLPFVALYGIQGFNAALLCRVLASVNVGLTWRVLKHARLGNAYSRLWMTALLGFGTVHFWCASWASSWLLGHVSTLFFLLLAFCFLFHPKVSLVKDFLSGLFFGLAVCCRLSALLGGIFFAGYLLLYRPHRWKSLLCFAGGAAVFGSLYMLYNYARYGTIMDESYSLTYLKDYHRADYDVLQTYPAEEQLAKLKEYTALYGGPLQTKFISYNAYSIFGMAPQFQSEFPFVIPTVRGVALTITSPALLLAIFCHWKKPAAKLLWLTTLATAVPFLLNYGNGTSQFGMRYAMDFIPYLFLLACMGMENLRGLQKGLVLWSVLVNAWGALYWKCFY